MNTKQLILDFLAGQEEMVLSTAGPDGAPQSAVVGFSETEALELFFGTSNDTRKYRNLQREPRVSAVIGFQGDVTVQYEGVARQVTGPELEIRQQAHFAKIPSVAHYKEKPGQVYFAISPSWIRYTNYTSQSPVSELTFTSDADQPKENS